MLHRHQGQKVKQKVKKQEVKQTVKQKILEWKVEVLVEKTCQGQDLRFPQFCFEWVGLYG